MSSVTRTLEVSRALCAVALAALLAGCGEGRPGVPVPRPVDPGPDAPVDAGVDAPPLPEAGPVKRTILTRNPAGGPAENLLVDGDFELSTVADGNFPQSGWLGFVDGGQTRANIRVETGGLCRTGLRCAVLERNLLVLGRGTAAPDDQAHDASVWAKVPAGASCEVMTFLLLNCNSFVELKRLAAAPAPDEAGWCEYRGTLSERESAVCLYGEAEIEAGETALVDSAVMLPLGAEASMRSFAIWVPPPDLAARVAAVQEQVRKTLPLSSPRPRSPQPVW